MRIASTGVHHPEPIAIIGEDDPFSVRRELGRIKRANLICQPLQSVPIDVDRVNFEVPTLVGGKIYGLTVRGERGIESRRREVRQLFSTGPIRVHDTDLVNLVDVTGKYNLAGRSRLPAEIRNEGRHRGWQSCTLQGWYKCWR